MININVFSQQKLSLKNIHVNDFQSKKRILTRTTAGIALFCILLLTGCFRQKTPSIKKTLTLFATHRFQRIDGFGVNVTPAQWNDGRLKPAIDVLVNELGANLIRFDCTGLANWLDPVRRNSEGIYPQNYLDSVYHSKVFADA